MARNRNLATQLMTRLKRLLKKPVRGVEFRGKALLARILKSVTVKAHLPIYLTFDTAVSNDGTGAQLQRQITIYSLAKYFGFNYVQQGIRQVAVHPLDPFQSESAYNEYLGEVNKFLNLSKIGKIFSGMDEQRISRFTFSILLRELINSLILRKPRLLHIHEPYPVSEFCPGILENLDIRIENEISDFDSDGVIKIVLHYRQGVGGFVIYPGQNIPREIDLDNFARRIKEITSGLSASVPTQIIILTDAPDSETRYAPPTNQVALWEGTPGFSNGEMTIKAVNFEILQCFSTLPLHVIRGGNPLEAIKIMACADYLIIGKSSLSFVGGLLNRSGQVYFPVDFWHQPLKNWRVL